MYEHFSDPARAACYVGLGLTSDFPNKTIEVTYRSRVHVRQETCPAETASRVLEAMCRRFHRASVHYQPDKPDGVVARIDCHCVEGIKGTCCLRGTDRPSVTVRVVYAGAALDTTTVAGAPPSQISRQ